MKTATDDSSLNRKSKTVFFWLAALLPLQIGRHFWPKFTFVHGLRLDYLSPTLYLTDLLILLILSLWLLKCYGDSNHHHKLLKSALLLLLVLSSNVFFAVNQPLAFFKALKISELFLLGFYVKENLTVKDLPRLSQFFLSGLLFSAGLAWLQFLKQGSLNGLFWFFGERTFTIDTPGIARTALSEGKLILRPYATFSHPNVLAGYLTVLLPIFVFLPDFTAKLAMRLFLIITVALTFSRSALAATFLSLLALPKDRHFKKLVMVLIIIFALVTPLWANRFFSLMSTDRESLVLRNRLNDSAWQIFLNRPVFGVGGSNFLTVLPKYRLINTFQTLQPVHNIYLLILAEYGLVGWFLFSWLIFKAYRKNSFFRLPLTLLLFLGLFDHYFLTLQQTQVLFAIILGLCFLKEPVKLKTQ